MKKTKLVIASILKPVDDTRMYEKFGLSLSQTNKYDINIIGFYSKNIPTVPNITFHPLFDFKRISLGRLMAPLSCLKRLIKVKPEILIVNTHELLTIAFLYKIIFGTKLIYDVRENYYRNIRYTSTFNKFLKPLIAAYVRLKEYASTLFVEQYILAEKAYKNELKFINEKALVIENKFKSSDAPNEQYDKSGNLDLLFTGTLAESTGIFEVIKITRELHSLDPSVRLTIIGYCAQDHTYNRLTKAIESLDFINLTGGNQLVPHKEILKAIKQSDFGFIYYPENLSTSSSTPTKLYEYLGSKLPVLIQKHEGWNAIVNKYDAGLIIDFGVIDYTDLLDKMRSCTFYEQIEESELLWSSEEPKLIDCIDYIDTYK